MLIRNNFFVFVDFSTSNKVKEKTVEISAPVWVLLHFKYVSSSHATNVKPNPV